MCQHLQANFTIVLYYSVSYCIVIYLGVVGSARHIYKQDHGLVHTEHSSCIHYVVGIWVTDISLQKFLIFTIRTDLRE